MFGPLSVGPLSNEPTSNISFFLIIIDTNF